jgi:glycosyltransferase involved in cell wall biosynthesis
VRILVATDQWFPDFKGGSARVATATATLLAVRGHEVTVLAPRAADAGEAVVEGGLTLRRAIRRTAVPQTLSDPRETARHARALSARFDVTLAHQATTFAGLRAARVDAPCIRVFHASALRELRFLRTQLSGRVDRARVSLLEPLVRRQERASLRDASRIFVLSEFSRSLVAEDAPEAVSRVRLVGGGVDASAFTPDSDPRSARERLGLPPHVRLLLSVRRFEPRMGLEELLRALTMLEADPPPVLALVGSGELGPQLERAARELRVVERVLFPGRVSDDELLDWYRAADLFVLPTVAYEGFGMATAEALAAGTPVVGTPVGATPELLRPIDPDLVATGADARSLADAIGRGLRKAGPELSTRCRAYASDVLAWQIVIERWESELAAAARVVLEPAVARP